MEYLAAYIILAVIILWFTITMIAKLKSYKELEENSDLDLD